MSPTKFLSRFAGASAVALTLASGAVLAGWPPAGVPSGTMPWQMPTYPAHRAYAEPPHPTAAATPHQQAQEPRKYMLEVTLQEKHDPEKVDHTVLLVAHLPEHAEFFVEGAPTRQQGTERQFESPPLTPGRQYVYTIKATWVEDGKKVSQTKKVAVHAGEMHCIDVVKAPADSEDEITANLARLSPEDQKLAKAQKFCVVQEDRRLGSMGVPAKVLVKGQPVFLCCAACTKRAQAFPDQTLAEVKKLKEKGKQKED